MVIYDRHAGLLLGVVARVISDRAEGEDVVHDVFVELWRRAASRFDPRLGAARPWLCRLARSRAIDRLRANTRRADRVTSIEADVVSEHAPLDLRSRPLRDALGSLPAEQREPIVLAYVHGHSRQAIAETLGVPVGTVKTRIRLGLRELGAALSSEGALSP